MKRAITGSFALLFAAGIVSAQNASPPAGAAATAPGASQGASASVDFKSVDTNKDGRVSSAEAQSNSELRSAFSNLDADRDSYLSQTEYQKWNKAGKDSSSSSSPGSPSPSRPAAPNSSSQDDAESSSTNSSLSESPDSAK